MNGLEARSASEDIGVQAIARRGLEELGVQREHWTTRFFVAQRTELAGNSPQQPNIDFINIV